MGRTGKVAGTVAAVLALAGAPSAQGRQAAEAYPPSLAAVTDLTGDGTDDIVMMQPHAAEPTDSFVRIVDGRTGSVVWADVLEHVQLPVETVRLASGSSALVVANRVSSAETEATLGRALRIRVVDGSGRLRWDRTFDARAVVGSPFPSYMQPTLRGVLRHRGADVVLVEAATRIEAGAGRLTRLTANLVSAETGVTLQEHGPYDTLQDAAALRPVRATAAEDDFAVLTFPAGAAQGGQGSITRRRATSGEQVWSTSVRSVSHAKILPLLAGAPARPALSVTTSHSPDDIGLQLLDHSTGGIVVDRRRGGYAVLADGTGRAGQIRTRYLSDDGEPNGYTVELLDLTGRLVRSRFFPVGEGRAIGVVYRDLQEAGDVDGDGWRDLLVHVRFSAPGQQVAFDDRIVDGRTLRSVEIPRNVHSLVVGDAGTAAVDGRGDDVVETIGRSARILDGRTRRPLLAVRSRDDPIGPVFGVRDRDALCADVIVTTYDAGGFALTRVGAGGEVRWSMPGAALTAARVPGRAGCARALPPAPPREPVARPRGSIPATGGMPLLPAAAGVLTAAAAALRARQRRAPTVVRLDPPRTNGSPS